MQMKTTQWMKYGTGFFSNDKLSYIKVKLPRQRYVPPPPPTSINLIEYRLKVL